MLAVSIFGLFSKERVYIQLGWANPLQIKAMRETFKMCWLLLEHNNTWKSLKRFIKCLQGHRVATQQEQDFPYRWMFMQFLEFSLSTWVGWRVCFHSVSEAPLLLCRVCITDAELLADTFISGSQRVKRGGSRPVSAGYILLKQTIERLENWEHNYQKEKRQVQR